MRRRPLLPQQRVAICRADKTIEQPVAVDVAAFLFTKKEPNSAEAMNPGPYSWKFRRRLFNGADRPQPGRMKKRGYAEQ